LVLSVSAATSDCQPSHLALVTLDSLSTTFPASNHSEDHEATVMTNPYASLGTASVILELNKAAWKLGILLSKLDHDTKLTDTGIKILAEDVKSLANECDLVYADLEEVAYRNETKLPQPYGVDGRFWDWLAPQAEETIQTLQDIELFAKGVREEIPETPSFISQAERQMRLDKNKDQITTLRAKICRHTDSWGLTLLLINT
jgi:hypothetical protein